MKVFLVIHVPTGRQHWFKTSTEAHQYAKYTDDTHVVKLQFTDRNTQSMVDFLNKYAPRA